MTESTIATTSMSEEFLGLEWDESWVGASDVWESSEWNYPPTFTEVTKPSVP